VTEQKPTSWKPSDKQKLWLHTAMQLRTKMVTKIAAECKVDRGVYYEWCHDGPEFLLWYNKEFDAWLDEIKVELIKSGVKQAETNHSWWRDMMILMGIMKPEQFEQQQTKPINQVNVMAAAFTKSAEERGIAVDGDITGSVPTASPDGSS
jgi:hypothetical protein